MLFRSYYFFENLDIDFFEKVREYIKTGKKPVDKKRDNRKYQNQCAIKVYMFMNQNPRCHIIMACGTGKSYIVYLIDVLIGNKKTVIFVPSLHLLTQMYLSFVKENCGTCEYLLIGSDSDLKNEKLEHRNVELTTDEEVINEKMKTKKKLIVICTYKSSERLKGHKFCFGIFDESHKTVGNKNTENAFALFD